MQIKKLLAHNSNYGSARNVNSIKYIVIHYTANKGDRAISNCKYFQSPNRGASATFFVDQDSIYQSLSEDIVGWSIGGKLYPNYKQTGGGKYYEKATNVNSISIEMCDSVDDVPSKTRNNVRDLVKYLMNKYNIPKENVIRHFDVTGKICPKPLVDAAKWNEFRDYITGGYKMEKTKIVINGKVVEIETINVDGNNYVKLRGLESDKIAIGYDSIKKTPTVTTK